MQFRVHGPFDLPRNSNSLINNSASAKKVFWDQIENTCPGLPDACGCYIFVVKARRGSLPWYVGLTTKKTFRNESFGAHQVNHYNQSIAQKNGVTAQLFFLAKKPHQEGLLNHP